jgi:large subunit ribosomal protein L34e
VPKPGHKSKSKRIVYRRVPGGRTAKHYESKTPGKARCGKCGEELHGIPKKVKKLAKTEKTVNRPYGGHYCSKCAREKIIDLHR